MIFLPISFPAALRPCQILTNRQPLDGNRHASPCADALPFRSCTHYTTKTGHILSYIKNFLKIFCQPTASPLAARARRQSAREKKPGGGTWRRKSTAAKQNGNRRGGTAGCAPRSARGRQHAKKPCTAGRALQGFYDLSRGIRRQADAGREAMPRGSVRPGGGNWSCCRRGLRCR